MADNIFTNNIALRKEFLEYNFPDQGIESINTQISRYVAQLNNTDINRSLRVNAYPLIIISASSAIFLISSVFIANLHFFYIFQKLIRIHI